MRGYESAGRYALALTQRLALCEVARRGAPAVFLLEDDVVFHPNFRALIATVELPEDWGIFLIGKSSRQPYRMAHPCSAPHSFPGKAVADPARTALACGVPVEMEPRPFASSQLTRQGFRWSIVCPRPTSSPA